MINVTSIRVDEFFLTDFEFPNEWSEGAIHPLLDTFSFQPLTLSIPPRLSYKFCFIFDVTGSVTNKEVQSFFTVSEDSARLRIPIILLGLSGLCGITFKSLSLVRILQFLSCDNTRNELFHWLNFLF